MARKQITFQLRSRQEPHNPSQGKETLTQLSLIRKHLGKKGLNISRDCDITKQGFTSQWDIF